MNYYQVIEKIKIIDILKEVAEDIIGEGTTFEYYGYKWIYDGKEIRTIDQDYHNSDIKSYLYLSEIIDLSNLNDKVENFQRVYHIKNTSGTIATTSITETKPKNWHYTFDNYKKEAKCCPVCFGRGFVSGGFYSSTGNTWVTSTTAPEQCRSCQGKGYIEI